MVKFVKRSQRQKKKKEKCVKIDYLLVDCQNIDFAT